MTNKISFKDKTYNIIPNIFWKTFHEWEPETIKIFETYLNKETTYIDIGTWIGPTILIANQIGVKNIFGIEANPNTFEIVKENCKLNNIQANLTNLCIYNKNGEEIGFGSKKENNTSSASRIGLNDYKVKTITLLDYLKENNILLENLFIKIDIEGAERFILEDLIELSTYKNIIIYLSIHPSFFGEEKILNLADTCDKFKIKQDSTLNNLTNFDIMKRISKHEGLEKNMFEFLLRT